MANLIEVRENMNDTKVRAVLRAFIVENFLYTRKDLAFSDDDSLIRKGIFDSLGVTEVLGFIEETWGLEIPPDDVVESVFGSVAGMAHYISARAAQARRTA